MLPAPASKLSPASRTTRDRLVDAGFHVTLTLLGVAIVCVFGFVAFGHH